MNASVMPIKAAISIDASARTRLRGRWLWVARTAWSLIALLVIVMFGLGLPLRVEDMRVPCALEECQNLHISIEGAQALEQVLGGTPLTYAIVAVAMESYLVLAFFVSGMVIAWRKSDDWMALFSSAALILAGAGLIAFLDTLALQIPIFAIPVRLIRSLGYPLIILLFYLFPNGRFTPVWARWPAFISAGLTPLVAFKYGLISPQGLPFLAIVLAGGVFSQIYRYRKVSSPAERQQTKWVIFGFTGMFLGIVICAVTFQLWPVKFQPSGFVIRSVPDFILAGPFAFVFAFVPWSLVPITFAISTLRFGLWNVDPILNRTLLYSVLTTLVIATYILSVGLLGMLLQAPGSLGVSLLGVGVVALILQPLRDRVQRGVNRLMYGERDDPYAVLSRLGQRLEAPLASDAVLSTLVETVTQSLKLPYAAIALGPGGDARIAATYGQPVAESARFPLIFQAETIGQLIVGPRASGETFNNAEKNLLANIAHQAGAAVHAAQLTVDLQRSRVRLVTTREEERRRLRRDLHDGLGPILASQGLKLAAARHLLNSDIASVGALLDQMIAQNETSVAEIRRLVYGLRPPTLDERGLVEAIRDHVAGSDGKGDAPAGLRVEVESLPAGLRPLPAAVEVAAYRIALEALTNVARHAQAQCCAIRFSLESRKHNTFLRVEVSDDGVGLAGTLRAGVGLRSMRERAEELGGSLTIEPASNGGTRVLAQLPLDGES